ncbi:MAG: type I-U CRISPR-associated protein Csx17 [Pirellula sp.]
MPETTTSQKIHVHRLDGCRPTPLAHYLKALGVLRLVAEQADPDARGWWAADVFHLATKLSKDDLEIFFLKHYSPSSILSPWLKGSGFYQTDDEGLSPIEKSKAARLENYRFGIQQCRLLLAKIETADSVSRAIKARTKTDSSFQTREQRVTTSQNVLFFSCIRLIEKELEEIEKRRITTNLPAEDEKSAKKLRAELETINELVAEPGIDRDTGLDQRPTRLESDELKLKDGYKRFLKYAEAEFAKQKSSLISNCKKQWRGSIADWFSVAVVIEDDDSAKWPALLGTGGNDGNLDFTNNFMQRLHQLFDFEHGEPTQLARNLIESSLFNTNSQELRPAPAGQFFPTSAGGPNCGSGFGGSVAVNIWDYVLMMEGTFVFRAGVSRRMAANSLPQAAAPFAVRTSGIGYGSSDDADEGARGEQWMPIWPRPSRLADVQNLFQQARTQVGRSSADRGTSMVRAVSRLGTARGISEFQRYGYIERNGLSNLAVPLGRYRVHAKENQHLLDAVSPWIDQLRRIANGKNAPISLKRVYRSCEDAMLLCTQRADARAFLSLLMVMADAEDQFLKCPKFAAEANARPIPKLDKAWLELIWNEPHFKNDHEVRLAFALAAQVGNLGSTTTPKDNDSVFIRDHWLPLERNQRNFLTGERGLASGPGQCAFGLPLEKALHKLFQRRLHEADSGKGKSNATLQLLRNYLGARLDDINAFIDGRVNDARILSVARALMAIDFRFVQGDRVFELAAAEDAGSRNVEDRVRDRKFDQSPLGGMAAYGVTRLAFGGGTKLDGSLWVPDAGSIHVRNDSIIYNRLIAGDLQGAIERAIRRAFISGLRPRIQVAVGSPEFARRIGAAICFGVSDATMTRIALGLTSCVIPISDEFESEFVAEK